MANRPTPAFLRRPRRQAEASGVFTRFKAEAARPEQQAIFRMMVKDQGMAGHGSLLATALAGLRTAPVRVALATTILATGVVVGHDHLVAPSESQDAASQATVSEAELAPHGLVAISATTRGKEPERELTLAAEPPVAVERPRASERPVTGERPVTMDRLQAEEPAASAAPWALAVAEASEVPPAPPDLPPQKPIALASPQAVAEPDDAGAGGPYAVWLPELKPAPFARQVAGEDYRVNLAVVRYPQSAEVIREDFTREVPWERPFEFVFEPFGGGALKVLGVRGLQSRDEAQQMCSRARQHGFDCVLDEG